MFKKTFLGMSLLSIMRIAVLAVPSQLTYSGRLLQNGALVNAELVMAFTIYDSATGSTVLWSTTNVNVEVNSGIYSVFLGDTNRPISPNVFAGDNAWLEVIVGGETLLPRTKLNSVGYALQAGGLSRQGGGIALAVSNNGYIALGGMTNPELPLVVRSPLALTNGINDALEFRGHSSGALNLNAEARMLLRLQQASNDPLNYGALGWAADNFGGGGRLAFYTGAVDAGSGVLTERVRINSTGQVGIGTATPNQKLTILENSEGSGAMSIMTTRADNNGAAISNIQSSLVSPNGNAVIKATISVLNDGTTAGNRGGAIAFYTKNDGNASNIERVRINSTGNVGIGTNTPVGALHLYTSINGGLFNALVLDNPASGDNSGTAIYMGAHGPNLGNYGARIMQKGYPANHNSADLYFQIHKNAIFNNLDSSWDTPLMIQKLTGYVGIGTTNPGAKLELYQATNPTLYLTDSVLGATYGGAIRGFGVGGSGGRLQLGTLDNGTYYPGLTMGPQGGYVGIGTISANANLHVIGTMIVESTANIMTSGQYSGQTVVATAAVTVAMFELLYPTSTGYNLARADVAATMPCVGMAIQAGGRGPRKILLNGLICNTAWNWTVGAPIYVSPTTAGGLTQTKPTTAGHQVQMIGYAVTSKVVDFRPPYFFYGL
jgi:hypothetical protein